MLARSSRRKPVDARLFLAPLCGLLLCCTLFLLITARFESVGLIGPVPSWPHAGSAETEPFQLRMRVRIRQQGYAVWSDLDDRMQIPRERGLLDAETLCNRVRIYRAMHPAVRILSVMPDDAITLEEIVLTLDALKTQRCASLKR